MHDWVVAGEPYRVWVTGPRNGFAFLAVGGAAPGVTWTGTELGFPLPGQVIGLAALDPVDGIHRWDLTCPAVVPSGPLFVFQALVLDPTGAVSLTTPSPFTVGWQHGRMP